MSLENFIPEVWSSRILKAREMNLVLGQPSVASREYEGDIAQAGDTVHILSVGDVTLNTYTKNVTTVTPEVLQDAEQILTVDQSKYFAFQVDDVDKRLALKNGYVDEATRRASYKLAQDIDTYIAALWSSVSSANYYGSNASPKTGFVASDIYEYLVELKVILDNADVPEGGRWCALPPFMHGYLLKDDRFVMAGNLPSDVRLRNGMVGQAAGFDIMVTNNLAKTSSTTSYKVLAGVSDAIALAVAIREVEGYRSQSSFADVIRGLQLYGAKVTRPDDLAVLFINTT